MKRHASDIRADFVFSFVYQYIIHTKASQVGVFVVSENTNGSPKADERKLAGKGGVGLVMFHLARRRVEFSITLDDCRFGDVWAHIGGKVLTIEVKTSRQGKTWLLRHPQIRAADIFCLVDMHTGKAHVITRQEMLELAANAKPGMGKGVILLPESALPPDADGAWHKIDGAEVPKTYFAVPRINRILRPVGEPKYRRVTRRLASGEMKTYEYRR